MFYLNRDETTSPDNSGFLEIASVSWATSIFIKGFKKTLKNEDLGELSRSMTAEVSKNQCIRFYNEEIANNNGNDISLARVFWRIVRTKILLSIVLLFLYLTVEFMKAVSRHRNSLYVLCICIYDMLHFDVTFSLCFK